MLTENKEKTLVDIPKPDKNRYFYLIYKTINLVNGKYYIGKHKTKNINDGYLGSGKILRQSIEKYGIENFKREIICFCKDLNSLDEKEKSLITRDMRLNENCYNIQSGGIGGDKHVYKNISPREVAIKAANTLKQDSNKLKERNRKIGLRTKERYVKNPQSFIGGISNKGKRKETDLGIQKHINSIKNKTKLRHDEWKTLILNELNLGTLPKEIEVKYKISLSSVYRTIAKIKGDTNAAIAY